MSKNTKELPTMPYRPFAETLDRIIGSTDEFKTKFYNAFEERRLKSESEPEEPESEPEKPESKEPSKFKSFFDNLFSGIQGSDLLQNISEPPAVQPTLTPSNAPQHKCVIREW